MSDLEKLDDTLADMLSKTWRSRDPSPAPLLDPGASQAPFETLEPPKKRVRKASKIRIQRDSFSTRVRVELLNRFYAFLNENPSISVVDAADEMFADWLEKKHKV